MYTAVNTTCPGYAGKQVPEGKGRHHRQIPWRRHWQLVYIQAVGGVRRSHGNESNNGVVQPIPRVPLHDRCSSRHNRARDDDVPTNFLLGLDCCLVCHLFPAIPQESSCAHECSRWRDCSRWCNVGRGPLHVNRRRLLGASAKSRDYTPHSPEHEMFVFICGEGQPKPGSPRVTTSRSHKWRRVHFGGVNRSIERLKIITIDRQVKKGSPQ